MPTKLDKEFGQWLRDSMSRLRWTSADLASKMDSNIRAVCCWRSGQHLTEERKSRIRAIINEALDEAPTKTIAQWIHDEMYKRGMDEPTLAEQMGVSQQAISNWVLGRNNPSEKKLQGLRVLFDDTEDVLHSPIEFDRVDCTLCEARIECAIRVANGLGMMCEGWLERELGLFEIRGIREQVVWWEASQNPLRASL